MTSNPHCLVNLVSIFETTVSILLTTVSKNMLIIETFSAIMVLVVSILRLFFKTTVSIHWYCSYNYDPKKWEKSLK